MILWLYLDGKWMREDGFDDGTGLTDGHGEKKKREGNYGYRIGNNVRGSHDDPMTQESLAVHNSACHGC
jgi:hypothetical protein